MVQRIKIRRMHKAYALFDFKLFITHGELNYNYKGIPVVYYENAVTERMANKT